MSSKRCSLSLQSRYGLTESQAAVYAESFDTNEGRIERAVQNLKMEYART